MRTIAVIIQLALCLSAYGAYFARSTLTDGLDMGSKPEIQITNSITLMATVNRAVFCDAAGEFVVKRKTGVGGESHFDVRYDSGSIGFYFANPNNTFHIWKTTATFPSNTWNNIAITYTWGDSNSIACYVDGNFTSGVWISNPSNALALTNNAPLSTFDGISTVHFGGWYSEFAVWNVALISAEISTIAKGKMKYQPLQIRPSNLVYYYPMDDIHEGTSITTSAGNYYVNRTRYKNNAVAYDPVLTSAIAITEKVFSYQPNE